MAQEFRSSLYAPTRRKVLWLLGLRCVDKNLTRFDSLSHGNDPVTTTTILTHDTVDDSDISLTLSISESSILTRSHRKKKTLQIVHLVSLGDECILQKLFSLSSKKIFRSLAHHVNIQVTIANTIISRIILDHDRDHFTILYRLAFYDKSRIPLAVIGCGDFGVDRHLLILVGYFLYRHYTRKSLAVNTVQMFFLRYFYASKYHAKDILFKF